MICASRHMKHRLTTEISGRSSGRAFQFGLEGCRRRLLYRLRSLRAALITQLGSLGADPIQEEIDGSFSMPFLGFWIRCDAVEHETLGMPEHKIEEHVSRKLGVGHLDLATSGGLTQNF